MMDDKKLLLGLYKTMLLIRLAEEAIVERYHKGEMRTPTHLSIGQEAVSTGVCHDLLKDDHVFASHRSHAAYLAKGGNIKEMFAELFGRAAGVSGGRSGSAHLSSPKNKMFSAPILGGTIPIACGAALAFKLSGKKNIAVSFFGDAAIEEGVFVESLNFAVLKKLPVLFVCENNLFSTHIPIHLRQPAIPIFKRVAGLGIQATRIDGNDVCKVHKTAAACVKRMRADGKPRFIECMTYRMREHVGPLMDLENPYRTKEQQFFWAKKCPIKRLENILSSMPGSNAKSLSDIRSKALSEVRAAVKFARDAKWPDKKSLLDYAK